MCAAVRSATALCRAGLIASRRTLGQQLGVTTILAGQIHLTVLDSKPFREQLSLMHWAMGLVAVHGQACAWAALMQPGSWLLEIMPQVEY